MRIVHGLISADSHVVLDKDAFTRHMSGAKWGDRIPQVREVRQPDRSGNERIVDRWFVNGQVMGRGFGGGVANCPAVMNDPARKTYPQRWEDVPSKAWDPVERLEAIDSDGIDAEVLFPNDPTRGFFYDYGDAEFELACVQAENDAIAEWRQVSDRFAPLAILPFLGGIEAMVAEVERSAKLELRGMYMLADPSQNVPGARPIGDRCWDPLWAACQDLDMPMHIHESGGLGMHLAVPRWEGFTPNQFHSFLTVPTAAVPAQAIPNIIFSGIPDRFPRLKWVCAETGLGWVNYVLEGCDHEWERRHLWTEGILTRPSEVFHRQMYVDFWYEMANVPLRHHIGVDNIMWQSDYPHTTSTYPDSWKYVERTLQGVPEEERRKILYENAIRVYRLD